MIAGVDVVKRNLTTGDGRLDEIRKVKLWSKVEALDRLAQHLGLRTQVDFTLTVQRAERMSDAEIAAELEVLQKPFAQRAVERQSLPAPAQSSSAAGC